MKILNLHPFFIKFSSYVIWCCVVFRCNCFWKTYYSFFRYRRINALRRV